MWLLCLLDPGQIRYRAIYTHPNQIPGYASGRDKLGQAVFAQAVFKRDVRYFLEVFLTSSRPKFVF